MIEDKDPSPEPAEFASARAGEANYVRPRLVLLGNLAELTQATGGGGSDGFAGS